MAIEGVHHIVCPVDFSDLSALALRYADALARCAGATLVVVYANPFLPPPHLNTEQVAEMERQFRRSHAEADQSVRRFVGSILIGDAANIEIRVVEALPVEGIRAAAEDVRAGIIVVGTHGQSGVNRLMMGSVAERLINESPLPVLTVRGSGAQLNIRRILCAVDNTGLSRRALAWACRIGRCFGAQVIALHVREPGEPSGIDDLRSWIPETMSAGALLREGDPAAEIVSAAAEADLVVIGAHHRRFHGAQSIGHTTVRVVRHAPTPVMTVVGAVSGETSAATD
ncbi:MAG TPA: universal stress protein [Bryobacteraceae bacterium]|nr:universal stress protein [Bryobacteraceae bacterium]